MEFMLTCALILTTSHNHIYFEGRDIVREFVTSMRKHELEPCFYIVLPWDASEYYDTDQQYFDVQVSTSTNHKTHRHLIQLKIH